MSTNQTQLQQQYEGTRLSAAAYAAQDIKILLSTNPSQHELTAGLHSALVKQGFSFEQANNFVEKYTPAAALDQDGAGAILFRVNGTNNVATAVRGTNPSSEEWFRIEGADVLADGTILQNQLPVYQTTLIANFVLRETTPVGQPVAQFSVQNGNSNTSDLARATADTLANAGGEKGSAPNLVTIPVIVQTSTVMGTGRAMGQCVDAAAHSEGAPEITTLGSAIAQCSRITTVNGPGVSAQQMQSVSDQIATQANRPLQDIASQNQLNVHTTGVSVIDGLNGGLLGDSSLLTIQGNSHSSIVAMNAAEAAYFRGDLEQRIAPVGTVAIDPNHTSDYNYPDTAGAGRGTVNPDAVAPTTTIFNANTALPNYSGDNAVTVQPGDTVGSIAKRYDMTVDEFSSYLKTQYGDSADLNSIVAGSKLPLPPAVYERTSGGVNGLDLATETSTLTPDAKDVNDALVDAFNQADQTAADLKNQHSGIQIADADGGLPDAAIQEGAEPITQTQLQSVAQGIDLFNSLMAVNNFDDLNDLGKFSTVANLYSAADGAGGELPGDLGGFASALGFMQGLDSDNGILGLRSGLQLGAMGLNAYSEYMSDMAMQMMSDMMASNTVDAATSAAFDAAAEQALESAAASSAASNAVPYVSIALALHNFEDNPAQSMGTLVGMYFGGPIGGAIGGFIGGMMGGMFGDDDPPPPPEGAVHFSWDAQGNIQHTIDFNQSGGGDAANSVAASVQGLLEQIVQSINNKNPSTADDVALNPYLIPKVGFSGSSAWIEVSLPDGTTVREGVRSETIATRLIELLQDNGGLAPAWQVQTVQAHAQRLQEQGASQADIHRELTAGIGGQAVAGDEAYALQGNAVEIADFRSQSFGALVVHVGDNPAVQARTTALSEVLRDVENDNYAEKTQWVAAKDSADNAQGLLVLDFNQNGLIETRDILNLGGNKGEDGNPTDEARLASQNADLQRNNVEWLDADGDGQLTAQDPAFAAIKLWIDINQNSQMEAGEGQTLTSQHISSINFKTGEVTYEDGHTDALTAQTLKADTEGVKFTQINEVNPDGTLHTLDAGTVLEHEGYQGKVQITDEGGTRWASEREQTYEQQAKRTGDWEGTAEQDAHRHGGGNAEGAPTETTATGTTDFGPIKIQANQTMQSTVTEGSARVVSDAPAQAPQPQTNAQPNAQTTVTAGDSRIKSNTTTLNTTTTTNNTPRPADTRIVFVPTSQTSVQREMQAVTDSMIQSSQSLLFGAGVNAGLGVLTAVGLGTVQNVQAAEQRPALAMDGMLASPLIPANAALSSTNTFSTAPSTGSTGASASGFTFRPVESGTLHTLPITPPVSETITPTTETLSANFVYATVIVNTPAQGALAAAPVSSVTSSSVGINSDAMTTPALDYPVVQGELLGGTEDVVLRMTQAVLLANDSTPNASADPTAPALTITAVSAPTHGQVSLVNGEVWFVPAANFHGTASFTYTVTDQYGLSTTALATLQVAAVNDAPVTQSEGMQDDEDMGVIFTQAQLLANDSDADVATDGQVLSISGVGQAQHGTVWLDAQGNVCFVPDANYNGPASFTYQVSDGNGGVTPASVNLTVMPVNDRPVAVGETISENEDTTLVISQAALLQNDSDVDVTTDGQVLSITVVSNSQHGTVTLNANGTISFVPEANFYGNASFDYTVDDGHGGTATTTAVIALANVNDAPVATGETINSNEDEVLTITASALLQNDSDIDNAHADLTISRVQSGTGGTVSLNASGDVVFTPTLNYNGTATFTYWVKDPDGLESNAVTTRVMLAAVNDAPSAQGEIVTGASEDAEFNINASTLLINGHDIDDPDSALSLSWVGNATGGTVSLDVNGNVVFTPTANFNSNATFQYKVQDAAGLESAVVQAVIPVAAVNDNPVAVDDQFTTYKNSTITIGFTQLINNDTDVDGDVLTVSAVRDNANGHASIVNGQVQFVANAGFTGAASFDYLTDDGNGGQAWATSYVTVKEPPNLYPTVSISGTSCQSSWLLGCKVQVNFSIQDDDDPSAAQMNLVSIDTAAMFYTGYSLSRSANGGIITIEHVYVCNMTWKITDARGLDNYWHYHFERYNSEGTSYASSGYSDHTGYYTPPVILDLNGDGVHFTSLQNSHVTMDVNFDGIQDKMAWAGNDDGVLVWDKDHNHKITDASEFGFQTLKTDAQTDLEGLQALDTNGNDLLDVGDAKFAEFAVWQDANGDGVTDVGEFKTLTELGIAHINLHSDGQMRDAGTLLANSGSGETDATVMGNAAFTRTDGTTGVVADTMLAYEAGQATQASTNPQAVDTSAADAQTAEIIRQALLFNQVCNTAVPIDSAPLGFVPIQPDVQLHDMLVVPQDGSHQFMQSA